jgi:hypothetical protein
MSTLYLQLVGGLGNQMFQYAHGKFLAQQHGMDLALDFVCEQGCTVRQFELHRLKISASLANPAATECFKTSPGTWQRAARSLTPKYFHPSKWHPQIVREREFPVHRFSINPVRDAYLIGYWQSEQYFMHLADVLRNEFQPAQPAPETVLKMLSTIDGCDAISIHIRRGDYVSLKTANEFHGVLGLSYYREAVRIIKGTFRNARYFVFSDDVAWVQHNLDIGVDFTIVGAGNTNSPEWDLALMAACRGHVIANSSFSWWGAWLNPTAEKIVIAPCRWFASRNAPDTRDLLPASWIRI